MPIDITAATLSSTLPSRNGAFSNSSRPASIFGIIENIVDDAEQRTAGDADLVHHALFVVIELAVFQQIGKAENCVQRCGISWLMCARESDLAALA